MAASISRFFFLAAALTACHTLAHETDADARSSLELAELVQWHTGTGISNGCTDVQLTHVHSLAKTQETAALLAMHGVPGVTGIEQGAPPVAAGTRKTPRKPGREPSAVRDRSAQRMH